MKTWLPALTCALVLLTGCRSAPGTASASTPTPEITPLTQEEVDRVNEAFISWESKDNVIYATPVNGFFTSRYETPENLDLVEFLRYFPDDGVLETEDADEFAALTKLPEFPFRASDFGEKELREVDLPVPTHRILRTSVDETLSRYAGISTADLKDTSGVLYLKEYDAYYTFTSDFGPGEFRCIGGEVEGNEARLWTAPREDGGRTVLTLRREGENWLIQSFLDEALER